MLSNHIMILKLVLSEPFLIFFASIGLQKNFPQINHLKMISTLQIQILFKSRFFLENDSIMTFHILHQAAALLDGART